MIHIDTLILAFSAGVADLERHAALLDRINVFPVMDADTGRNLCQTLLETKRLIDREEVSKPAHLTQSVCPALLRAAQGNSGVIAAQFLTGFFATIAQTPSLALSLGIIQQAVSKGRQLAYHAVRAPKEGTMLTVMTALNEQFGRLDGPVQTEDCDGLDTVLLETVANTQAQMQTLSEARVVDAGALGFYILSSGLILALSEEVDKPTTLERIRARHKGDSSAQVAHVADRIDPQYLAAAAEADLDQRYCINLLLELSKPGFTELPPALVNLGVSADTVQHDNLLKLHIHSDDVESVLNEAGRLGRILEQKIEDMREQMMQTANAAKISQPTEIAEFLWAKFKIVSDSSISLSYELAAELGIDRMENRVTAFGKSIRDRDLDRDELFKRMREGCTFTTSTLAPDEIRQFLDRHLKTCEHLFYIAVGRAYTATQDIVRKVVADHPQKERITVCDTVAASGQQGLICIAAAQFAPKANTVDEMKSFIDHQIKTCREYLVIDDLKYLQRSGRIGRVKAAFAGALKVKPIVGHGPNGAITYAKARSHEGALVEITQRLEQQDCGDSPTVLIEKTDNHSWIDHIQKKLAATLPLQAKFVIAPLSSTSAVHMGPGSWGVVMTVVGK